VYKANYHDDKAVFKNKSTMLHLNTVVSLWRSNFMDFMPRHFTYKLINEEYSSRTK